MCAYVGVHTYTSVCMRMHLCVYACICEHVCVKASVRAYVHVCVCAHMSAGAGPPVDAGALGRHVSRFSCPSSPLERGLEAGTPSPHLAPLAASPTRSPRGAALTYPAVRPPYVL